MAQLLLNQGTEFSPLSLEDKYYSPCSDRALGLAQNHEHFASGTARAHFCLIKQEQCCAEQHWLLRNPNVLPKHRETLTELHQSSSPS